MPKKNLPEICIVEGCTRQALTKGMCLRCYGRMKHPPKTATRPYRKSLLAEYAVEHRVLQSIKSRCNNPKAANYDNYGGKGIKVDPRWTGKNGLKNFIADMGKRPGGYTLGGRPIYSIDRIDPDGDYTPSNCKWSTIWEQNGNTSRNKKVVGVYQTGSSRWKAELTIAHKTYRKCFNTEQEAIKYRKWMEDNYLTNTK